MVINVEIRGLSVSLLIAPPKLTSAVEFITLRAALADRFILRLQINPSFCGGLRAHHFRSPTQEPLPTQMNKGGPPTQEAFDKLLRWLDSDRDKAGEKYERIRIKLISFFSCRGCYDSEDLVDETINVVASRIDWLLENYVGDPRLYFYGVAKKIYLVHLKPKPLPVLPVIRDSSDLERECSCLEQCLKQRLTQPERQLVLRYHEKYKREKIEVRKQLAQELGISINALRIRVCHIQSRLRPCIEQCLRHLLSQ